MDIRSFFGGAGKKQVRRPRECQPLRRRSTGRRDVAICIIADFACAPPVLCLRRPCPLVQAHPEQVSCRTSLFYGGEAPSSSLFTRRRVVVSDLWSFTNRVPLPPHYRLICSCRNSQRGQYGLVSSWQLHGMTVLTIGTCNHLGHHSFNWLSTVDDAAGALRRLKLDRKRPSTRPGQVQRGRKRRQHLERPNRPLPPMPSCLTQTRMLLPTRRWLHRIHRPLLRLLLVERRLLDRRRGGGPPSGPEARMPVMSGAQQTQAPHPRQW